MFFSQSKTIFFKAQRANRIFFSAHVRNRIFFPSNLTTEFVFPKQNIDQPTPTPFKLNGCSFNKLIRMTRVVSMFPFMVGLSSNFHICFLVICIYKYMISQECMSKIRVSLFYEQNTEFFAKSVFFSVGDICAVTIVLDEWKQNKNI